MGYDSINQQTGNSGGNIVLIENENKENLMPKLSLDPLDDNNITQNATIIARVFQSINFTINMSQYNDSASTPRARIILDFENGTQSNFNMTKTKANFTFTYTYTPEKTAGLGNVSVHFQILNKSGQGLSDPLNSEETIRQFTIISNCMAYLSATEITKGQNLDVDLTILSAENLTWEIQIVNNAGNFIKNVCDNLFEFTTAIDSSFTVVNDYYHVKVIMTAKYDASKIAIKFFKFKVLNHHPIIDPDSIVFSPSSVYRTKICRIDLNVTDSEDAASKISVKMFLEDPEGGMENYTLTNNDDGTFLKSFFINETKPAGSYAIKLIATDTHGVTDTYLTTLDVLNNAPKIKSYTVNEKNMNESVSVLYGENLVFTFNVEDIEGISYIGVELVNENDEWLKVMQEYKKDMTISIRTIDLISGNWYVYIYVTDTDGIKVGLDEDFETAPQEITIIPDILSSILPWITLFVGLTIGILSGLAAGFQLIKRRNLMKPLTREKTTSPKKTQVAKKKTVPKKKDAPKKKATAPEKKTTTKGPAKKETAKEQVKKTEKKQPKTQEDKSGKKEKVTKPEKEEQKAPQRKIKRKLK